MKWRVANAHSQNAGLRVEVVNAAKRYRGLLAGVKKQHAEEMAMVTEQARMVREGVKKQHDEEMEMVTERARVVREEAKMAVVKQARIVYEKAGGAPTRPAPLEVEVAAAPVSAPVSAPPGSATSKRRGSQLGSQVGSAVKETPTEIRRRRSMDKTPTQLANEYHGSFRTDAKRPSVASPRTGHTGEEKKEGMGIAGSSGLDFDSASKLANEAVRDLATPRPNRSAPPTPTPMAQLTEGEAERMAHDAHDFFAGGRGNRKKSGGEGGRAVVEEGRTIVSLNQFLNKSQVNGL